MPLFTLQDLHDATAIVRTLVPPTPAYAWPLLQQRVGPRIIVKHENHTPTGSFKARGGLVFVERLLGGGSRPKGLVTATRGNHGQSIALAATRHGLPCIIVVPEGNSVDKNAAMAAFGGQVLTAGKDFDESRAVAAQIQEDRGFHIVPPFHPNLVVGVATYAHELFTDHPDLDCVYAPIGMGSGLCGLITVRDILGLKTEIVGVVAENAPAFALSFEAGKPVSTESARTFADGMACRDPGADAFAIIKGGAARIVTVSDDEIAEAIRILFATTHNVAEGAGAAALAGVIKERHQLDDRRVGIILCGGNIDTPVLKQVLDGETPTV